MILVYRVLIVFALVIASPFLIIKALSGRHGIKERFGFIGKRGSSGRLFWFHAASVGELKVLSAVIPKIQEIDPDIDIAISTTTITGRRRAREIFSDKCQVFLQPLELKSAIRRTLETLKPEKIIMVETEIWPLLITEGADFGAEVDLINGRLTAGSYRWYKTFKPFFAPVLRSFGCLLVQTENDAARFRNIGAENTTVLGNVKYDQIAINGGCEIQPPIIDSAGGLVFVAGSIRKGEDRIFADLISGIVKENLPVKFVLVPRHMKDVVRLGTLLDERGIDCRLRSESENGEVLSARVLIVDTMGELSAFYRMADIAFVGGSLVPIGGHDPVEPAALGKPALFGPFMDNARESARALLESGGALEVRNVEDLVGFINKSLADRDYLISMGARGKMTIESLKGASKKTADILMGVRK